MDTEQECLLGPSPSQSLISIFHPDGGWEPGSAVPLSLKMILETWRDFRGSQGQPPRKDGGTGLLLLRRARSRASGNLPGSDGAMQRPHP